MGAYLAVRYRGATDGPQHRVIAAMEHLGSEMDARVPAGTRVWVDDPDEVWWFRMQELVTMHGLVLTKDRAGAELVLRRRPDPAAPGGTGLEITAVAG
ncbi:hypothetical protein [Dactylosporangium sp. CS-033363]|uniref:hypothetical protein n=1 Tax=Dactylosporangium sp. CS-033363 TaxID=3239935 RepID=UPI003D8AEA71